MCRSFFDMCANIRLYNVIYYMGVAYVWLAGWRRTGEGANSSIMMRETKTFWSAYDPSFPSSPTAKHERAGANHGSAQKSFSSATRGVDLEWGGAPDFRPPSPSSSAFSSGWCSDGIQLLGFRILLPLLCGHVLFVPRRRGQCEYGDELHLGPDPSRRRRPTAAHAPGLNPHQSSGGGRGRRGVDAAGGGGGPQPESWACF
eukprot:COSAG05_NODE_5836_length_1077_cov_1.095092_2_plen_200_part_01